MLHLTFIAANSFDIKDLAQIAFAIVIVIGPMLAGVAKAMKQRKERPVIIPLDDVVKESRQKPPILDPTPRSEPSRRMAPKPFIPQVIGDRKSEKKSDDALRTEGIRRDGPQRRRSVQTQPKERNQPLATAQPVNSPRRNMNRPAETRPSRSSMSQSVQAKKPSIPQVPSPPVGPAPKGMRERTGVVRQVFAKTPSPAEQEQTVRTVFAKPEAKGQATARRRLRPMQRLVAWTEILNPPKSIRPTNERW